MEFRRRTQAAVVLLLLLICGSCERKHAVAIDIDVPAFGKVTLYRHQDAARHLIFLFSDDKGWRPELTDRAWAIAWPDRVVVAIDTPRLVQALTNPGQCTDYAGALDRLKQAVAARLKVAVDPTPFFAGLGSGGTVAYMAAVETPSAGVQSVVTEGFCPALDGQPPPCPGAGGLTSALAPAATLTAPLVAIARPDDCPRADLQHFVDALPDGRLVEPVPGQAVDLLASVVTQTMARSSGAKSSGADAPDLKGIPIVTVPAAHAGDDRVAVVLSGDGGWADIDKEIGEDLAKSGVAVVGFNSLKYFWNRQSPEQSADDLTRVIRHALKTTGRTRLLLVGYSFGADVLPFLYPRLPADIKSRTALMALLALSPKASFEIAVGAWIGVDRTDGPPLAPALAALDIPVLCVHSSQAADDPCPTVANPHIEVMTLPGDHHFNHAYAPIAAKIIARSAGK